MWLTMSILKQSIGRSSDNVIKKKNVDVCGNEKSVKGAGYNEFFDVYCFLSSENVVTQ